MVYIPHYLNDPQNFDNLFHRKYLSKSPDLSSHTQVYTYPCPTLYTHTHPYPTLYLHT